MRAVDEWAIERAGEPSLDLMERAGAGLARIAAEAAGDGPLCVVVGKGNNGGDGLVAARLLREDGHVVRVLAIAPTEELRGDAATNLERLPGAPPEAWDPAALEGAGVVVDALLGTGFEGEPREPVAGAIAAINAQAAPVVACDLPSGVNATTGEVEAEAVRATVTATFHGPKVGLWVEPAKGHAGLVEVVEIGVPRGAPAPERAGLISERVLALYPHRSRNGSKFDSGVVVVAGGAAGLTGAPTMAARSAARAGAGYVQVAVPASAQQVVELRLLEQMTRGLPDEDGGHTAAGADDLAEMAERAGAVVLGPGLGPHQGRGGVRPAGLRRGARAAAGGRRRAERARGRAGELRRARGAHGAHATFRRDGTSARDEPGGGGQRTGWTARAGPRRRAAPWCS